MLGRPVIYLAFANHKDRRLQALIDEQKHLVEILEPLDRANRAWVRDEGVAYAADIAAAVCDKYRHEMVVFHFSGHGTADGVETVDKRLDAEQLAGWLEHQSTIQLVFLNACETLEQARVFRAAKVPAILVTRLPVEDHDAARFAVDFYRGLADGRTIGEAYAGAVSRRAERKTDATFVDAESSTTIVQRGIGFTENVWQAADEQPWHLFITEEARDWRLGDLLIHYLLRAGSREVYEQTAGDDTGTDYFMRQEVEISGTFASDPAEPEAPMLQLLMHLYEQPSWHAQLLGEGGAGKSLNLRKLWGALNEVGARAPIPVHIRLHEYDTWETPEKHDFIISQIIRNYLRVKTDRAETEAWLWEMFRQPVKHGELTTPAVLLLLDGFNEITAGQNEQRPLFVELSRLAELPGVQMLITSRFEITQYTYIGKNNIVRIQQPANTEIAEYLYQQGEKAGFNFLEALNGKGKLRDLICNPFNLSLYTRTAPYYARYKDDATLKFREVVETRGELMWNYYQAQLAIYFERLGENSRDERFLLRQFILEFFLPVLTIYLQDKGGSQITTELFDEQTDVLAGLLNVSADLNDEEIRTYAFIYQTYFYGEAERAVKGPVLKKMLEKILLEETGWLKASGVGVRRVYTYSHEIFPSFFTAYWLHYEIQRLVDGRTKLEEMAFSATFFSTETLQLLGEMLGDHRNRPDFSKSSPEQARQAYRPTLLDAVLEELRRRPESAAGTIFVPNALETWNAVRGTLAGADLSHLDLRKAALGGKEFSRWSQHGLFTANFDGALLDARQFIAPAHSAGFDKALFAGAFTVNKRGDLMLSSTPGDMAIIWRLAVDSCFPCFRFEGRNIVYSAFLPTDDEVLLVSHQAAAKMWLIEVMGPYADQRLWRYEQVYTPAGGAHFDGVKYLAGEQFVVTFDAENSVLATVQLADMRIIAQRTVKELYNWTLFHGFTAAEATFFTSTWGGTLAEWDTRTLEPVKSVTPVERLSTYAFFLTVSVYRCGPDRFLLYYAAAPELYEQHHGLLATAEKNGLITSERVAQIHEQKRMTIALLLDWRGERAPEWFACDQPPSIYFAEETPLLVDSKDQSIYHRSAGGISAFYLDNRRLLYRHDFVVPEGRQTPFCHVITNAEAAYAIASLSSDRLAIINLRTGRPESELVIDDPQNAAFVLRPDGRRLVVVGTVNVIREYDIFSGQLLREFDPLNLFPGQARVTYAPDGNYIYAGYSDGQIVRFATNADRALTISEGRGSRIVDVAYAPEQGKMAVALASGYVQEYDLEHNRFYQNTRLEHFTEIARITYDFYGFCIRVTDNIGSLINIYGAKRIFGASRPKLLDTVRLSTFASSRGGRYRAWADPAGEVTIKKRRGKHKKQLIRLEPGPVVAGLHFLRERKRHLLVFRRVTVADEWNLYRTVPPTDLASELTEGLLLYVYDVKRPEKPVWWGGYVSERPINQDAFFAESIGEIAFAAETDDFLLVTLVEDRERPSYQPNYTPGSPTDHALVPTRLIQLRLANVNRLLDAGALTYFSAMPPWLTLFNLPPAKFLYDAAGGSVVVIFNLESRQDEQTFSNQMIIGEIPLDNPQIVRLARANHGLVAGDFEIRLVPGHRQRIALLRRKGFGRDNLYLEYAYAEQAERPLQAALSSYPSTLWAYHELLPEAQIVRSFVAVPDFFLFGCSFERLHPASDLSEPYLSQMRTYGAIFDEADRAACAAIDARLAQ